MQTMKAYPSSLYRPCGSKSSSWSSKTKSAASIANTLQCNSTAIVRPDNPNGERSIKLSSNLLAPPPTEAFFQQSSIASFSVNAKFFGAKKQWSFANRFLNIELWKLKNECPTCLRIDLGFFIIGFLNLITRSPIVTGTFCWFQLKH